MNDVDQWLAAAEADVDRRGLPTVKPLLQGLAAAVRVLRGADWNDRADAVSSPPGRREPGR